jgi:outer membrane protein OmpA-like peptidoglycan-associated protein
MKYKLNSIVLTLATVIFSACSANYNGKNDNQDVPAPLVVRDITPSLPPQALPQAMPPQNLPQPLPPQQQLQPAPQDFGANIPNLQNRNTLNINNQTPLNLPAPQQDAGMFNPPKSLEKLPAMLDSPFITIGDRVYFDFNSAKLNREALVVLSKQVKWMQKNPKSKLLLEGHDDARGSDEFAYNIALHRAMNVKRYLVAKGINEARIKVVSYGKAFPEYAGTGEATFSKNRRVVSVITNY